MIARKISMERTNIGLEPIAIIFSIIECPLCRAEMQMDPKKYMNFKEDCFHQIPRFDYQVILKSQGYISF